MIKFLGLSLVYKRVRGWRKVLNDISGLCLVRFKGGKFSRINSSVFLVRKKRRRERRREGERGRKRGGVERGRWGRGERGDRERGYRV